MRQPFPQFINDNDEWPDINLEDDDASPEPLPCLWPLQQPQWEQINFLRVELTKLQENQERLFDIVSRHSQILTEMAEGFDLMLNTSRTQLIFNPALFDAKLTWLENQIRSRLRQVTHALQAGLVQKLAIDYLTPNKIRNLYTELVASSK